MALITNEVRALIGKEVTYRAPEEIGRASIRYFAIAIGDDNPVYRDEQAAKQAGYPGVIAPPTFICETNQYMHRFPGEDGYIGHLWSWELPIKGIEPVRGGNEYEFFRPVGPTDRITATWRIEDISEKQTSDGKAMLILKSLATYINQEGEKLATNLETILYIEGGESG